MWYGGGTMSKIELYLPRRHNYQIEADRTYFVTGESLPTYHIHGKQAYLTVVMLDDAPYEIEGATYDHSQQCSFATMREALAWLRKQERLATK